MDYRPQSIAEANALALAPKAGDRIVLTGGRTYPTAGQPLTITTGGITLTSEGGDGSPATIDASDGDGCNIYYADGCSVSRVNFVGSGKGKNSGHALRVWYPAVDAVGSLRDGRLRAFALSEVKASGFYGTDGSVMAAAVRVESQWTYRDAVVIGGLEIWDCAGGLSLQAVLGGHISDVHVHDLSGSLTPGAEGHGIALAPCDGTTVERCIIERVGSDGAWRTGSGIFAVDSDRLTIRKNIVRQMGGTKDNQDGAGICLDWCSTCGVEENLITDGAGADIAVGRWDGNHATYDGNVVRGNRCYRGQQRYADEGSLILNDGLSTDLGHHLVEDNAVLLGPETPIVAACLCANLAAGSGTLFTRNTFSATGHYLARLTGAGPGNLLRNTWQYSGVPRYQLNSADADQTAWRQAMGIAA